MPGQRFYNQTVVNSAKGERWFCSQWQAWWAGWPHVGVTQCKMHFHARRNDDHDAFSLPARCRKGLDGLATLIQEHLKKDPFSGHLFAFRGKNASLLKILFWDGTGLCLFTKRMDHGQFMWPRLAEPGGSVALSPAQLAMLIEGIDWRAPERFWRPMLAG